MIKKLIFNAYCNPNISSIVELNSGERLIICKDKWELINDLSFFKSLGLLTKHKISIGDDLVVNLWYEERLLVFYLFNEEEIDVKSLGSYHKLY